MNLSTLQDIVAKLRDPDTGCPWDLRQNFSSIAAYTLEEAYEVIDAINREDYAELQDELGDLLLQVIFHAQIASEQGYFTLADVESSICDKMVRRHPHVFGDTREHVRNEAEVRKTWEAEKARERAEKDRHGVLDGIARTLPALKRAQKLQKRAANVGFDWMCSRDVIKKIYEELGELEEALAGENKADVADELGDLLFSCVNLVRHLKFDAESMLMGANAKFEKRFRSLERQLHTRNRKPQDCRLDELEEIWQTVKRRDASDS